MFGRSICAGILAAVLSGCSAFEGIFGGLEELDAQQDYQGRILYVTPYPDFELRSARITAEGVANPDAMVRRLFGPNKNYGYNTGDGIRHLTLTPNGDWAIATFYKNEPGDPDNQTSTAHYVRHWIAVSGIKSSTTSWIVPANGGAGGILHGCDLDSIVQDIANEFNAADGTQLGVDGMSYTVDDRVRLWWDRIQFDSQGRLIFFFDATVFAKPATAGHPAGPDDGSMTDPKAAGYAKGQKRQFRFIQTNKETGFTGNTGPFGDLICTFTDVGSSPVAPPEYLEPAEKLLWSTDPDGLVLFPTTDDPKVPSMADYQESPDTLYLKLGNPLKLKNSTAGETNDVTVFFDETQKLEPGGVIMADVSVTGNVE
ncbi:MAG: hypothetical protein QNJ44_23105 [Rhodobacter sp.]|nr:hypothetical protein [Rhodobacter sp.]